MGKIEMPKNALLRAMAEGPIEWRTWSADTLRYAAALDRPLCVCVVSGASRWTFAMKENFDDAEIVKLLNHDFVPVLCDEAAAPDVAVAARTMSHLMLGHAGQPLFLFLTPAAEPIFAASYMPKQSSAPGVPGMLDALRRIKWLWLMKRPNINEAAVMYARQMKEALTPHPAHLKSDLADVVLAQLESEFDDEFGGWEKAPKFPQAPKLTLLAWLCQKGQGGEKARAHLRRAVAALCGGGLYDRLNGGFHDYCRDRAWLQPYLGKHLGQNVALLAALLKCWDVLGDDSLLAVFGESVKFLNERFRRVDGLFSAGEDLSQTARIDAFYLWKKADADAALAVDSACLGMTDDGNYCDPVSQKPTGLNLPFFFMTEGREGPTLPQALERLRQAQMSRSVPPLCTSTYARDNAAFAAVLAFAGRKTMSAEWCSAAEDLMGKIEEHLILGGALANAVHENTPEGTGTLGDVSALIWAYLELYKCTGKQRWIESARAWAEQCGKLFGGTGAMKLAASDVREFIPVCDAGDGFMFSGAGTMLNNLISLYTLTGEQNWRERAESLISAFGGEMNEYPADCAGMTLGALRLSVL